MSDEGKPSAEVLSDRAFENSRVFDAPRERVFRAWTDPEHLKQWWGPKGFTNTFHEFDMRPGGHWRFVMHADPTVSTTRITASLSRSQSPNDRDYRSAAAAHVENSVTGRQHESAL